MSCFLTFLWLNISFLKEAHAFGVQNKNNVVWFLEAMHLQVYTHINKHTYNSFNKQKNSTQ